MHVPNSNLQDWNSVPPIQGQDVWQLTEPFPDSNLLDWNSVPPIQEQDVWQLTEPFPDSNLLDWNSVPPIQEQDIWQLTEPFPDSNLLDWNSVPPIQEQDVWQLTEPFSPQYLQLDCSSASTQAPVPGIEIPYAATNQLAPGAQELYHRASMLPNSELGSVHIAGHQEPREMLAIHPRRPELDIGPMLIAPTKTADSKHKCPYCGKTYLRRSHLTRHLRIRKFYIPTL
jgi:hypothetical protein